MGTTVYNDNHVDQNNTYNVPVATQSETAKAQREAARKLIGVSSNMNNLTIKIVLTCNGRTLSMGPGSDLDITKVTDWSPQIYH